MHAAKKVKAPAALLLLAGKGSAKAGPKPDGDEESEDMGDEVPPDFEEEAIAAFPELDGSPERIAALHRAIKLHVR